MFSLLNKEVSADFLVGVKSARETKCPVGGVVCFGLFCSSWCEVSKPLLPAESGRNVNKNIKI